MPTSQGRVSNSIDRIQIFSRQAGDMYRNRVLGTMCTIPRTVSSKTLSSPHPTSVGLFTPTLYTKVRFIEAS